MMRRLFPVVVLTVWLGLATSSAEAQVFVGGRGIGFGGPRVYAGAPYGVTNSFHGVSTYSAPTAFGAPSTFVSGTFAPAVVPTSYVGYGYEPTTFVPPYSYYTALYYGIPPRTYVGYGANDPFPFHGRIYGRPYDPWTWPALSGAYPGYMARYFYPILR